MSRVPSDQPVEAPPSARDLRAQRRQDTANQAQSGGRGRSGRGGRGGRRNRGGRSATRGRQTARQTPPGNGPGTRVIEVETVYSMDSNQVPTPNPNNDPPPPSIHRTPEELYSPIPPSLRRQARQLDNLFDQDPNWAYDPLPPELEQFLRRIHLHEQDLDFARSFGFTTIASFVQFYDTSISDACDLYPKRDLKNPAFQNFLVHASIVGAFFADIHHTLSRRPDISLNLLLPEDPYHTDLFIWEYVNFHAFREHYRATIHPTRKEYLDYIEELLSGSSLVGSHVSSTSHPSTGRTKGGSVTSEVNINTNKSRSSRSSHASKISTA